ncbi:Whole genome shotgun sequence [Vibrio parahaemolyticus]
MFDHQCDAILNLAGQEEERLGNKKGKATEASLPWEGERD